MHPEPENSRPPRLRCCPPSRNTMSYHLDMHTLEIDRMRHVNRRAPLLLHSEPEKRTGAWNDPLHPPARSSM